jgi:choice-of-anchor A domain-containing protein/LPXTG-motif cell wall-anchored protein
MTLTLRTRALALSATIATLAAALVSLPATPLAPADSAAADTPACVAAIADYPNVHGQIYGVPWGFYGVDPEVGVYIAGDWNVVPGAAEAEGTIVVGGSATFNSGDYFNVGTVGLGSQVSAGAGTDMLTTGSNISVGTTTTVDVGNHRGGNLVAGGTISPSLPSSKYELNGGTATDGVTSPLTPYASVPLYYSGLSTSFAALPIGTETVDLTTDPSEVRFIGDGVSMRQVFTVSGTALGTDASQKGVAFSNIPANAVIVINVTGASAQLSSWGFSMNGTPLDFSAAEPDRVFSGWTQSITWNFASATDVSLGLNGQLPGSVLIPTASSQLDLRTSINGRLYVNGDVTFGGSGTSGLEIHNYPLRNCTSGTGSLAITKTLTDTDDIVDDTRAFTGTYSCTPTTGADITGTWSVTVGATQTVTGLPDGAVCTITEDTLSTGPSADTSYVWGTPTYSPTSGTVTTGGTVTLTAQNSFSRQTGSFAITKALTDPDAVVASGRLFTGDYTCAPQSGADITGSWSVEAGDTQTVTGIPVGSTCTIIEDALTADPSATDPSYNWGAPTYSPSSVTTTSGTVTITATNVVTQGAGSFTIAKAVTDPDAVVASGRHFTGTYSCATGSTPVTGTWDVTTAASQTVSGIPAGASCSITEDALAVAPSSSDSSYTWGAPTYSPSAATITDGGSVTITATNTVRRGLGHLELVKVLDDPFNVVSLSRVYTGTFECIHNSADITPAPGTWSTTAGAPAITLATDLPAGTVCTVTEDALTDPPLAGFPQYIWRTPVISPATITIADGVTGRFTVTNIVYDPFDLLASTGTDAGMPLAIGGGAMLLGLFAVFFGYRRRRRS